MLAVPIRQILAVPDTFRAVPQETRKTRVRPEPSPALMQRLEELRAKGIPAEIRYSQIALEWYIRYHGEAPDWPTPEPAEAVWRKAVELCR